MNVVYEKRVELYPAVWEYFFRPEQQMDYLAGQYLTLTLPDVIDDPRGSSRTLTITSLANDPLLSFIVNIPTPCSSYKQRLQTLEPGYRAIAGDALGDLVLPKDPRQPLVFIAGGIGIASFAGMLKQLVATKEVRDIYLFYSLRNRDHRLYRELTEAYPLTVDTTTISPNRLSAEEVLASTPPDALYYVSGGQPFVEDICKGLVTQGVPRAQLIFDYFDGYPEL